MGPDTKPISHPLLDSTGLRYFSRHKELPQVIVSVLFVPCFSVTSWQSLMIHSIHNATASLFFIVVHCAENL
ncbi:hypothetical protein E2C01_047287 [Portunus trituberculatus]|uniref:Uncharacterized protein n=1 Tax=Portunus trituberculatus TaxID=210409 RepID=A0A5B7G8E7_PORTR|nr:hypothetical protein [Portunus trituberculatus]